MDFSQIDYSREAFCHLSHPVAGPLYEDGDKDKPVGIWTLSKDSKEYRTEVDRQWQANQGKKSKSAKALSDFEADNRELVAAVCTRADHCELDGKPITSKEQFVELFSRESTRWIFEQVNAHLNDRAGFFSPSEKS